MLLKSTNGFMKTLDSLSLLPHYEDNSLLPYCLIEFQNMNIASYELPNYLARDFSSSLYLSLCGLGTYSLKSYGMKLTIY